MKLDQHIVAGLTQALAWPEGTALHSSGAVQGLFRSGNTARMAAKQCMEQGLLETVRTETRGKTTIEFARLSEAGLRHLLQELNPKDALERLASAAERLEREMTACRETLRSLHANAATVLAHVDEGKRLTASGASKNGHCIEGVLIELLRAHSDLAASADCSLAQLFARLQRKHDGLTVGAFHDALRSLHQKGQVLLHPWTGPLPELPEPSAALLVGHAVVYYASLP